MERRSVTHQALVNERGGLMLGAKHRLTRDPYFHFHPLQAAFSLLGLLLLFGLMAWILAVPAH